MAKQCIKYLWDVIDNEIVNETLVEQLEAIKCCIETPGVSFMTQEEVNAIGSKGIALLEKSLKEREIPQDSDDEDDEEFQLF